jgi:choline dehydrogenase-like flavoprotein
MLRTRKIGGGTLALHLAQAGKNILILERGPFMPQEKLNWDTSAVFLDNRYHTKETWQDKDANRSTPNRHISWAARPRSTALRCSACGPKTLV